MNRTRFGALLVAAAGFLAAALVAPVAHGRNLMSADGPGGTYELLQRAYTIEVPDCAHMVDHITEEIDEELGKNVFVFHSHVKEDNDRCINFDRQRTEIRARSTDIVAANGQTVYYRWKFRLPEGFQTSPNFTHIFQIKSDLAPPVMTLTPRQGTMTIDGRIGVHGTTELPKFLGAWVVVNLRIVYAHEGQLEMNIQRLSDGEVLFSYSGAADMWDDNAGGHDIKFGVYRSLTTPTALRDEQVRFADFCASKESASDCDDVVVSPPDAAPPEPVPTPEPPAPPAPPTPRPMTRGAEGSGGCNVATANAPAGGWAVATCLLLGRLARRRRRRERPPATP